MPRGRKEADKVRRRAVDRFLASHPASAAYLSQPNPTPASFATQAFFGNNAFVFVNARAQKQTIRYHIVPVAGEQHLSAQSAAAQPPDFLNGVCILPSWPCVVSMGPMRFASG